MAGALRRMCLVFSFPWTVVLHSTFWQGSKAWGSWEESEGGSMWWLHKSPAQVARTWGGTSKPRQTRRGSSRFPSQEQNYPCAPGGGIEITAKPLGLQEASPQDLQGLITTDPTIRGRSQQTPLSRHH